MIYLIQWEKYGFEAISTQLQICLVSIHLLANHIYQKYINDNWFNKKLILKVTFHGLTICLNDTVRIYQYVVFPIL